MRHGFRATGPPVSPLPIRMDGTILNVYSATPQTVRLRQPGGAVKQMSVEAGSHKFEFTGEPNP